MTRAAVRIAWIAGHDGIAHAHRPGLPRTLCGLPGIGERFAWPERFRCMTCVRAVVVELR